MRVVIAGGGTGGHLFPGIAVAEELVRRNEGVEIVFMGTEKGVEARVIPREGYDIRFLRVEGVLGRSPLRKLSALLLLLRSVLEVRQMLRSARPDVVIGTGGYVSVGPVVAAWTMKIPTMILEQNIVPGLANRALGKIADSVAVTYHESMSFFDRRKTMLTGNPIRAGILKGSRDRALGTFSLVDDRLTVFVVGGSRGARKVNGSMMDALNLLLDLRDKVQFLHQTGDEDYEPVRKRYRELGYTAMVAPFVYQMAEAYAVADVLVSRSGATTMSEFTALGKAAILVPYPDAGGHQEFNAKKLLEVGGCMMISDRELGGQGLADALRKLLESEQLRNGMRKNSRALGRPDAAKKVVDIAESLARAGKGNV